MKKLLILYDSRGYLARSLIQKSKNINISVLKEDLKKRGFIVETKCLHALTFPCKYKGWFVLYPSSEDYGLFYKGFIEDILLRLEMEGAVLLPRFEYFRAHHNKVFMELCRTCLSDEYQTIKSCCFYTTGDLEKILKENAIYYPVVLKCAQGAGSAGVEIAENRNELLKKARRMGKINYEYVCCTKKDRIRHYLGRIKRRMKKDGAIELPSPREKLIIQTYIPNLSCDYKVLVFGEKYYLLKRYVREGEFRASGSGKLEFPNSFADMEKNVLEYAYGAYKQINSPMLSIDIAFDGKNCHMLEFQCLNFGPYTLQYSSCYYKRGVKGWEKIEGESILEEEMAEAVAQYVDKGNEAII